MLLGVFVHVSDTAESHGQGGLPTSLLSFPLVLRRFRGTLHSEFKWSCEWLQGFGFFLQVPFLLHSEYKWPGFPGLGCICRVSARIGAVESGAAA